MNNVLIDGKVIGKIFTRKAGNSNVTSFAILNKSNKTTNLVNCEAWNEDAKRASQLKAGDFVFVSGQLDQQSWQDKATGDKKSSIKVKVATLSRATPFMEADDDNSAQPGYQQRPQQPQYQAPAPEPVYQTVSEEEIPF